MDENRKTELRVSAAARRKAKLTGGKRLSTHYKVEAFDKYGVLKWVDEFENLVVTAGLNDSLTQHFKGSNYTAAWYVGLTDGTPTAVARDLCATQLASVVMGHSHLWGISRDRSGAYWAVEAGMCADPIRLRYAEMVHRRRPICARGRVWS